jgi:Flp pilus assembly protein TadD/predicted aspartyl protease
MRPWLRSIAATAASAIALSLPGSATSQPARADAEIQLQFATLLFKDGRYEHALDAFRRARDQSPPEQAIIASHGVVRSLLRLGEFHQAFAEAEALARTAPRWSEAFAIQAEALWASGRFEESERTARHALAVDSASARARHGLARALAARGRLNDAIDEARAALALEPAEGEYHYTLGSIYQRLARFDEAAAAFTNYVNLLPNRDTSEKAAWARAQIRFLESFSGRTPLDVTPADRQVHIVPFRLIRDKIVVKARVNAGAHIDVVLDTGAEMTILSEGVAKRAGVRPVTYMQSAGVGEVGMRGLQVGSLESFQIGNLTVRNVPVLIKSPALEGLPTRETEAFSPLAFGMSMTIDYRLRLLTIGSNLPRAGTAVEMPLWMHRLAMVRGVLNGSHPANFVVDTGGEVISISQSTAGVIQPDPPARRIPLKVYGTSGWDRDAFLLPFVDLAFADVQVPQTAVVVLNLDAPSALLGFQLGGIVGHRFLSKYTVTVDLERSMLALGD